MSSKTKLWAAGAAAIAVALAAGGVGITVATGGDDDVPITGPALEQASAAALDHTGGGRVTGTEAGDEDSYYEVEVTLEGGGQVDVQLDENFNVVDENADSEAPDDDDSDGS